MMSTRLLAVPRGCQPWASVPLARSGCRGLSRSVNYRGADHSMQSTVASAELSRVDVLLRSTWSRCLPKRFYNQGFGATADMLRLYDFRAQALAHRGRLTSFLPPVRDLTLRKIADERDYNVYEGNYTSPALETFGDLLPARCQHARFQYVEPKKGRSNNPPPADKNVLVWHFGSTGEHFLWRRRVTLAQPMASLHGLHSIIPESPYYGQRRPPAQVGSTLNSVLDLFVMGLGMLVETTTLHDALRQQGAPTAACYSGFSLGGFLAAFITAMAGQPDITCAPCMAGRSANLPFTKGAMSTCVDWAALEREQTIITEFLLDLQATPGGDQLHRWTPDELRSPVAVLGALLDTFTDLAQLPPLEDVSHFVLLAADRDAYIPYETHRQLAELWSGADARVLDGHGHVTSFFLQQAAMREAIADAATRLLASLEQAPQQDRKAWA